MSFQTSALIVTWVALLLMALVVSGLVRQVHALSSGSVRGSARLGLRPGSPAPALDRLGVNPPALLLFLSEDCRTCADLLDASAANGSGRLHVLYAGAVPAEAAGLPVPVHGNQAELFARYDAIATPFAVVIGDDGRVARSEPLGSRNALQSLLEGDQVGGRS